MTGQARLDPATWRPQDRLVASIASLRQLRAFNDAGGIAVNFDVMRARVPDIAIVGSQSKTLSLWETRSASGFVTKPKFNADLLTIRFITSGHIRYSHQGGVYLGTPTQATLIGFEDLWEVQASAAFGAVSATISVQALAEANVALTGGREVGLPPLATVADAGSPGMMGLFCTIRQVQRRIREANAQGDLVLPLMQEVTGYQLLSAWPRETVAPVPDGRKARSGSLRLALDYIDANLSAPLTLADLAASTGVSVRTLQDKFRKEIGRTPVQYIIERRLARAHEDLRASRQAASVAEIARRWGFVHMSDFGQRYRRLYGCTPAETRRDACPDV